MGTQKGRPPEGDRPFPCAVLRFRCLLLAAGELLAQSLKCLIRSERTTLGRGCLFGCNLLLGGVRGGFGCLFVCDLRLGDLLDVSLPALVRLRVLLFPHAAGLVEAVEPLAGLRVLSLIHISEPTRRTPIS